MKYESLYVSQTIKLIEKFKDKNNQSVKDYILTCHRYINELRNLDVIQILDDLEYEHLFFQVLGLVEETYRPDQFRSVCSDRIIRVLDDEFIVYIIGVQSQLKRPLTWIQLCSLQFNFSILEIQFKVKNDFEIDFTQYAIKNIKLKELWTNSKH